MPALTDANFDVLLSEAFPPLKKGVKGDFIPPFYKGRNSSLNAGALHRVGATPQITDAK